MGGTPKIWMDFGGRSVLEWTLCRFRAAGFTDGVVVSRHSDHGRVTRLLNELGMLEMKAVSGGSERYRSVMAGLRALSGGSPQDIILVHDAARFLVPSDLIDRVQECAQKNGAALPVMEVLDTVKEVDQQGRVVNTLPRKMLRLAQTPQGFRRDILEAAYEAWDVQRTPTDDAEVVERWGGVVRTVAGDVRNQKLTRQEDVAWFREALKSGRDRCDSHRSGI